MAGREIAATRRCVHTQAVTDGAQRKTGARAAGQECILILKNDFTNSNNGNNNNNSNHSNGGRKKFNSPFKKRKSAGGFGKASGGRSGGFAARGNSGARGGFAARSNNAPRGNDDAIGVNLPSAHTVESNGRDYSDYSAVVAEYQKIVNPEDATVEALAKFSPHAPQVVTDVPMQATATTMPTGPIEFFTQLPLSVTLQSRLHLNKFATPTPVQAGAIPPALMGRDVLATAQTGTGKTLSFLIPIIEQLQKTQGQGAHALILLPTRELAMQVEKSFLAIRTHQSHGVALVVGGMAEGPQLKAMRTARVIVATPGRLEDFLKRRLAKLGTVKMLVLDEVDRMLDMGFQPAIARIASLLPEERQTLCYSATLDAPIQDVARKYLRNPARVEIGSVLKPSENVELRTFEVEQDKKHALLEHLLNAEKGSFLVFVRTKHGADRVARRLEKSGWSATQIHGDRSQSQRNNALRSFAEGHHRVLVATDVAARGLDVKHVAHVVNYDMPKLAEDFVHRVGRTGRAQAKGVASTFTIPQEKGDMRKIERMLAVKMKKFRVKMNGDATTNIAAAM